MSATESALARAFFAGGFVAVLPLASLAQTLPAAQYAGRYVVNADIFLSSKQKGCISSLRSI